MEGKLPAVQEHLHLINDIRKNVYCIMPLKSQGLFATVASSTLKIHVGSFIWERKFFFTKKECVKAFLCDVMHYLQCKEIHGQKCQEDISGRKLCAYKKLNNI